MVIGVKTEFTFRAGGRVVRLDFDPDPPGAGPGTYHGRVVGGPQRLRGFMITNRTTLEPRSKEAYTWAAVEALQWFGGAQ